MEEVLKRGGLGIGSERFLRWIRERYEQESRERVKKEDVSFRRGKGVVEPAAAIRAVCEHFGLEVKEIQSRKHLGPVKPVLAGLLVRHAAMTQREAAERIGLGTGASVCLQLKKLDGKEGERIRKEFKAIQRKLNI